MQPPYVVPYSSYKGFKAEVPSSAAEAGNMHRQALLLIGIFTLLRLVLAQLIELGNDESYYWLYTQYLQWNYFDHPPAVALWARIFTLNGLLDDYELFVRLGSIVGAALSTWFIYRATATLYSPKAGWYAAVLYNTSFYAGIVAGLLIMPDSPQMICWTFSLWMFARIIKQENSWKHWILFGLGAGLCIMSKVHGVFLWGGAGLYLLLHRRQWLWKPQLYAALAITLVVVSPVLIWNLQYDFATYRFHSQRVVVNGWALNLRSFWEEVCGQILFNNPVNFLLAVVAFTRGRKWLRAQWQQGSFLAYMALPLIALLLYLSLFRTVYPHWSGPAYVSLVPLSAGYLAAQNKDQKMFPAWIKAALVAAFLFFAGWPVVVRCYGGTWGSKNSAVLGNGDVSLDRYGWKTGGKIFADYYSDLLQKGRIATNMPLVCNTWWGAHVEYYFARPAHAAMIGLGPLHQTHHYLWTNAIRKKAVNLSQAFCIVPSDEYYNPAIAFKDYYQQAVLEKKITLMRGRMAARHFYVYRLTGWKGKLPVEGRH